MPLHQVLVDSCSVSILIVDEDIIDPYVIHIPMQCPACMQVGGRSLLQSDSVQVILDITSQSSAATAANAEALTHALDDGTFNVRKHGNGPAMI